LTPEAVEGAALAFQGVHHVHGRHGLALGVLGVSLRVADHVLQENLQHPAGLLVDQPGDTLDTAAASQTANSGLGDALDVIPENLAMPFGASFPQPLPAFA
uniref:Uncharacterized protein n=1 Tax=Pelodiscus sinensis TaxID=13735 RepID=K7EYL1_PELSI